MAAIDAAADIVIITDPQGTIQYVNPAFTTITGYSPDEAIGQNPRLLKSGIHDADFYRELWQTILAGRTWHGEVTNRRKDGTYYHEEMTITPVFGEDRAAITNFVAIKWISPTASGPKRPWPRVVSAWRGSSIRRWMRSSPSMSTSASSCSTRRRRRCSAARPTQALGSHYRALHPPAFPRGAPRAHPEVRADRPDHPCHGPPGGDQRPAVRWRGVPHRGIHLPGAGGRAQALQRHPAGHHRAQAGGGGLRQSEEKFRTLAENARRVSVSSRVRGSCTPIPISRRSADILSRNCCPWSLHNWSTPTSGP